MINARYDEEFIFHDGTSAKNILELVLKLEHMSNSEFCTFVNWDKNDFSNWISIVLNDKHLADNLRVVFSREETLLLLRARITELSQEQINPSSITTTHSIVNDAVHNISSANMLNTTHHAMPLLSPSAIRVSLKDDSSTSISSSYSSNNSNHSSNSNLTQNMSSNVYTHNNMGKDISGVIKQDNVPLSKEVKSSRNWFSMVLQKASFKKKSDELPQDTKSHITKVSSTSSYGKTLDNSVNANINNTVSFNTSTNVNTSASNTAAINTTNAINTNNLYKTNYNTEKPINTNNTNTSTKISLFNMFSHKSKSANSDNVVVKKRLFFRRIKPDNTLSSPPTENKSEQVVIYEHDHLWAVLYIVLIVLIVSLLIYKLFLI